MELEKTDQKDGLDSVPLQPKNKKCRYCLQDIPTIASVCSRCVRDQNPFFNHLKVDHIGLIIALIMMVLAYLQFDEAKKERTKASEALERAQRANARADILEGVVKEGEQKLLTIKSITNEILRRADKAEQATARLD